MPLQVKNKIEIEAPAAKVWEVLTTSEYSREYMFGCAIETDWHPGSTLVWAMEHEGKRMVPVKGTIIDIVPNVSLHYTVIDPNADMEDIPENYLHVHYSLLQHDDITTLTIVQDGFENAANGDKRYEDVYNKGEGWNPILVQIKDLAESANSA